MKTPIVLFYAGAYPSEYSAMAKRLHYYAKALQLGGFQVEIWSIYEGEKLISGIYNSVPYTQLPQYLKYKNKCFKKINYLRSLVLHKRYFKKKINAGQIIFLAGFGWLSTFLFILTAQYKRAKVVLEVNENPCAPEGGRFDPPWLRKIHRQFTLNIPFRLADGFIVISDSLEQLVNKYRSRRSHLIKIPILCDAKRNLSDVCSRNFIKYKPFIFHAGALSETKDGVLAMIKGFVIACNNATYPIFFLHTSQNIKTSLAKQINSILKEAKLQKQMVDVGKLSEQELQMAFAEAAMAIINKPKNWQNNYNFPTKMAELLNAGVPLIASRTGEMQDFLQDEVNALMVEPNDALAIAEKITWVLAHPEKVSAITSEGKAMAMAFFHYELYSNKLAAFLKRIESI